MTITIAKTTAWTMPSPDTKYFLEGGGTTTPAMMLKDVHLDAYPTDAEGLEMLLTCFGAWEDRAEMEAALAMRHSDEYMRNAEHEPGITRA